MRKEERRGRLYHSDAELGDGLRATERRWMVPTSSTAPDQGFAALQEARASATLGLEKGSAALGLYFYRSAWRPGQIPEGSELGDVNRLGRVRVGHELKMRDDANKQARVAARVGVGPGRQSDRERERVHRCAGWAADWASRHQCDREKDGARQAAETGATTAKRVRERANRPNTRKRGRASFCPFSFSCLELFKAIFKSI